MRLALVASATSLFSYASPAIAQVPVFQAERAPEPEPAVAPGPAVAPTPSAPPAATAPAPAASLPPSPVPPPGSTVAPEPANAHAPAKAEVITAPGAHREAEARADAELELDEADELASAHQRHWYGWQTLISDGASVAALIVGSAIGNDSKGNNTLAGFGLVGYAFAPGVVHFTHGNVGRGFASFGLRLGLPLAGAFLGASLASGCNTNLCEAGGAGVGILAGMGGAIAVDAAVFAYDDPKRSTARRSGLVPLVAVTTRQAWLGVGGQL